MASLINLSKRFFIHEFIVINNCAKNSTIISLATYDIHILNGSKCLYVRYTTKIFAINAMRKKIIIVLPYKGLLSIFFLNHFTIFFNLCISRLNHIKYERNNTKKLCIIRKSSLTPLEYNVKFLCVFFN